MVVVLCQFEGVPALAVVDLAAAGTSCSLLVNFDSLKPQVRLRFSDAPPSCWWLARVQFSVFDMDLLGYAGCVAEQYDRNSHQVFDDYYWSSTMRITGESDEILRNQIAESVLGLPGEPRLIKMCLSISFRERRETCQ